MSAPVKAAIRRLPRLGDDSSGPLGGLLASDLQGTIIRALQAALAEPDRSPAAHDAASDEAADVSAGHDAYCRIVSVVRPLLWLVIVTLLAWVADKPRASAGDVNGDGFADAGISRAVNSDETAFQVSVVFGKPGSDPVRLAPFASGSLLITGPLGAYPSLAVGGDLTGDYLADLVVSDSRGPRGARGHVWIAPGRSAWAPVEALDQDPSVTRIDPGAGIASMLWGEPAGDINGDGSGDLLIVRRRAGRPGVGKGYSMSVLAGPFAPGATPLAAVPELLHVDFPWWPQDVIEPAGDVDGDGLADVLVAAEEYGPLICSDTGHCPGRAFVVFGSSVAHRLRLPRPQPGLMVIRNRSSRRERLTGVPDLPGTSGPALGDIDGDRRADLLLTFAGFDGGPTVLLYGRPRSDQLRLTPRTVGTTWLAGPAARQLAAAGDLDRDGHNDLLQVASETGQFACVIKGRRLPRHWRPRATFAPSCLVQPVPRGLRDGYRYAERAGDVNGDGRDDVLLHTTGPSGADHGSFWTAVFSNAPAPVDAASPGPNGFIIR